ncbi:MULTISPECIES: nitroreductase family protein [Streptomyces]|uniref:nitroreductase family protein n=1 Tax=Streptomyces TaxID=1883 RepID=UPI0037B8DC54
MRAVTTRRAVRKFTDRPVPRGVLERVLPAAAWAPSQLKSLVTGAQRRTLGMPRPIQEMISRWISLLPPPKVKMTALR